MLGHLPLMTEEFAGHYVYFCLLLSALVRGCSVRVVHFVMSVRPWVAVVCFTPVVSTECVVIAFLCHNSLIMYSKFIVIGAYSRSSVEK